MIYGDATDAGVTVFSIPNLNVVRKITWDRSTEKLGGVLPATEEVAILRSPQAGSCCQSFRILGVGSGEERTAQLPALNFRPFIFFSIGRGDVAIYLDEPGARRIAILSADTFGVSAIVGPAGDTFRWYDLSRDGKRFVTAYSFGVVQAWDTSTGELLGAGNVNNFSPGQFTLSKSGRELVATSENLSPLKFSVPDFSPLGPPFVVGSASGSFTVFGADDESFFSFDVRQTRSTTGRWMVRVSPPRIGWTPVRTVRLRTGGSWMVKQALDGSWARWSLPGLEKLNQSAGTFGAAANNKFSLTPIPPVVSADGRSLLRPTHCAPGNQAGCSGRVVLWNAESGDPIGDPVPVANPAQGGGPGLCWLCIPSCPSWQSGGPLPRVRGTFISTFGRSARPAYSTPIASWFPRTSQPSSRWCSPRLRPGRY